MGGSDQSRHGKSLALLGHASGVDLKLSAGAGVGFHGGFAAENLVGGTELDEIVAGDNADGLSAEPGPTSSPVGRARTYSDPRLEACSAKQNRRHYSRLRTARSHPRRAALERNGGV